MKIFVSLFEGIADPLFQEYLAKAPKRRFPKGMVIFDQGEKTEEIYCITAGEVEIVKQNDEGDLKTLAELKSGAIFGEFSYLTGEPRSNAALAKEETTLLELSTSWLREVEVKHPEIRDRLMELYRERALYNVLAQTKLFSTLTKDQLKKLTHQFAYTYLVSLADLQEALVPPKN